MKRKELENRLRDLKFIHLTESELIAYCDDERDQIRRAGMEAHLKHCYICERQLELMREESEALKNRRITDEDIAFVDQMIERTQKSVVAETLEIDKEISLQERLTESLRQMVKSWRVFFMKGAVRGDQGEEVWRWQSKDDLLQVRATIEKNADLMIHFSLNEIDLAGARLKIRLGKMNREVILERVSDSEIYAKVAVPRQYRREGVANISIESV